MHAIARYYLPPFLFLFVVFVVNQAINYKKTKEELHTATANYNKLLSANIHSSVQTLELVLDNLTYKILDQDDTAKHTLHPLVEEALRQNPYLAGLALSGPLGNHHTFTAQKWKNIHNLDIALEDKAHFKESLSTDSLVVGKAYLSEALQEWVIPFQKIYKDKTGKIIGAVSTIVTFDSALLRLSKERYHPEQRSVIVKNDRSMIYSDTFNAEIYEDVEHFIDYHYQNVEPDTSISATPVDLRYSSSYQYQFNHPHTSTPCYVSLKYNKEYKLWILTFLPISSAQSTFWSDFSLNAWSFFSCFAVFLHLLANIYRKEKKTKKLLQHQAEHDLLTTFPNRTMLSKLMEQWKKKYPSGFYILHLDLDNFKRINDNFGHSYGDITLMEVGKRLTTIIPKTTDIVRHGGDEFALFIKKTPDFSIKQTCTNILSHLSQPYTIRNMTIYTGCSIGVSQYPQHGEDLEGLMIAADLALQKAKERKDCSIFFNNRMQQELTRKSSLERHLRTAIENDELFMVFQPQVSVDNSTYGLETLIRWKHPALGFVPPDEFIGVAESSGLMSKLGRFIIENSCKDFAEIMGSTGEAGRNLSLSINISVLQFYESDFQNHLFVTLEKYGIDKKQIVLEITETMFVKELEYIHALLEESRKQGLRVSLDDFGTGYSSLSMLRNLPIDELKIDKAFIDDICTTVKDFELVKSIISMGHNMGMTIVAEGVESIDQAQILKANNCDLLQGYYLSKPLRKEDLITHLNKQSLQSLL